jgi:hypothetical protein
LRVGISWSAKFFPRQSFFSSMHLDPSCGISVATPHLVENLFPQTLVLNLATNLQ